MKKLLILIVSIILLAACNNDKSKTSRNTENQSKGDYRNGDSENEKDKDKEKSSDDKGDIDRNSGNYDDVVDDDEEGNHVADGANWSSRDINDFTRECVDAAVDKGLDRSKAQTYCNCMLRKLTAKYPDVKDAAKIDMESPSINKMAEDCLGEGTQNSSSSTSTGWSRKQELEFVSTCVKAAQKEGMEYLDAQSYCDCMQYKIEKLYPVYADANRLTKADLKNHQCKK